MTTEIKTLVVDADAHVVESPRTWDFLDADEEKYRPALFSSPDRPQTEFWVVDGKPRGTKLPTLAEKQLEELSKRSGFNVVTAVAAREMDDVQLRLDHMDELGVDVQVLHNTLWISNVAELPDTEAVLTRCWNRWMADAYHKAQGRLRWSCVLPTMTISEALVQMRYCKENGAVAVCMRAHEGNRHLIDPYFYPLYEEAQRLDLAVVVPRLECGRVAVGAVEVSARQGVELLEPAGADSDELPRVHHERGAGAVPRPALGVHRGERAVGAVGGEGGPPPRAEAEATTCRTRYSRSTASTRRARRTTTCRSS